MPYNIGPQVVIKTIFFGKAKEAYAAKGIDLKEKPIFPLLSSHYKSPPCHPKTPKIYIYNP